MIVVSNTTPIIVFAKLERLDILENLFGTIYISPSVYQELTYSSKFEEEKGRIMNAAFLKIKELRNEFAAEILQRTQAIDKGESETIILAKESNADLLIMDEKKGRSVAKLLGLRLTGSLGILLKAKEVGVVSQIEPLIKKLIKENIRISPQLVEEILKQAKEK
ncbi:DUF3368 domain-containing protein [Caldicellulosiruptor acetigenus]|uniref:Nucleic acid binding protein n=1 Tax=Caldicellulosiruptor acetigenus 6A TaxID=632516 RepID=G2PYL0_9FIRM|nr:DUF3368 domain-containing protein [Caldicellulosiruptor acetigenus]AEM74929.1 nucleic acid binding protein [Caldicellulosiruptor acetigenus 6A]